MNKRNGSKKQYIIQAIIWIVLLIISLVTLPNINKLVRQKGQIQLPSNLTSQVADNIQNHWGRHENNTRQVVVVFNNGNHRISEEQQENINATINSFKHQEKKYHIKSMTAPNENKYTREQLISKDHTTEILQLNVDKKTTVAKTRELITKGARTPNVKTYVTGSDILNDDFISETQEGIKKTETITIIFIFIVLALIFRSPLTPIFSLLSVGISMLISLSVVMNLAKHFNFPLSNFTQVFMVVVLFGIGTDYNILMFDQFKEELSKGISSFQATKNALRIAGKTILFSGSSVLIGFSTLGLARFSIYRSAVGVAVSVAILLLALLTFNPFFMAILGKKIFWPSKKFEGSSTNKMWHNISKTVVRMPFIGVIITALCALPFLLSKSSPLNYDTLVELNNSVPAKEGFKVVEKHFSKGTAEPTTLYIKADHSLNNEKDLREIDELANQIRAVKGVKTVATVTEPGGSKLKQLYVNDQLKTITKGTKTAQSGLSKISGGLDNANTQLKKANIQDGVAGAKQLYDGSQQLQNGTLTLANGANTLGNGMVTYANGVYTLNRGMSQFKGATGELGSGVDALYNGANRLNNGLSMLNSQAGMLGNGVNQLVNGSNRLASGSNDFVSKLNDVKNNQQLAEMQPKIKELQKGAQQVADGLSQVQSQLNSNQMQQLKDQISGLTSALSQLQNASVPDTNQLQQTAQNLASNGSKVQSDAESLKQSLLSLKNATGNNTNQNTGLSSQDINGIVDSVQGLDDSQKQQLQVALQNVSNQIGQKQQSMLNDVGNQIQDVTNNAQSLQDDMSSLKNEAQQLDGLQSMIKQLGQLKKFAEQPQTQAAISKLSDSVNQLQDAINQLAPGSSQVANGVNQLSQATGQIQTLINQVTVGATQLSDGANALNNGINQFGSKVPSLVGGISQLAGGSNQLTGGIGSMRNQIPTMINAVSALSNGTGQLAANAPALISGASQVSSGAGLLAQKQGILTNGLGQMYGQINGMAGKVNELTNGLETASNGTKKINSGLGDADRYLTGLKNSAASDTYYVPNSVLHSKEYQKAEDSYLSQNKHAVKFMIVLDNNPSSLDAMKTVENINSLVNKSIKGTSLSNSKVALGGQTAYINDTRDVASKDFIRTAIIMLIGILVALMIITRSILQPFYILGTLILAYIMSLDLTQMISKAILGQTMLTWNTPFFSFIMLIALGVDYSIFLMMKYQEYDQFLATPDARIVKAATQIGAVVVSAALILSGTFAALIPSGVLTLIQVALVVIIGLTILVFAIPTVIPSLLSLTYPIKDSMDKTNNK